MLMAALACLRGSFCIYQGEELGLPQAELRFEDLVDPYDIAMFPDHAGRDGGRTPMPWTHNIPNAGFSTNYKTWLPLAEAHVPLSVNLQERREDSVLSAYKDMIAWRKGEDVMKYGDFYLLETDGEIIAYTRDYEGKTILCVFNAGEAEENFELPNEKEYTYLDHISHNAKYDESKGRIALQPFGYALLETA